MNTGIGKKDFIYTVPIRAGTLSFPLLPIPALYFSWVHSSFASIVLCELLANLSVLLYRAYNRVGYYRFLLSLRSPALFSYIFRRIPAKTGIFLSGFAMVKIRKNLIIFLLTFLGIMPYNTIQ
jgi:hypothetical protein